jgi:hypothetical protein
MRAVIQVTSRKAEEEPIVELLATTRTPPGVVWAPIRAARDPRDAAYAVIVIIGTGTARTVAASDVHDQHG